MVIEVTRVVSDLVNVWRDDFAKPIILLKIDRQVGGCLFANLRQSRGIFFTVDSNPNDVRACFVHQVYQRDRCVDIGGLGCSHRLDSDRVGIANRDAADLYGSGRIASDIYH